MHCSHVRTLQTYCTFLGIAASLISAPLQADNVTGKWSIVPNIGFSALSDESFAITNTADIDNNYNLTTDSGFTAGLSVRYRYNPQWESEFGWEYRSNDSEFIPSPEPDITGGNYASNIFFINGRRYFTIGASWQPYIGAGLQVVQEIDIDYETAEGERSFSSGGDLGFQLMGGFSMPIGERLTFGAELRYGSITDLTLGGEGASGTVTAIDYETATAQVTLGWQF